MSDDAAIDVFQLGDLATPWAVHVAVTLQIAELIDQGTCDIETLSAAAGCRPDPLARMLRLLAARGVFVEPTPGTFELNAAARQLMAPEMRLGLNLDGLGGRMALAWSGLLTLVRTGETAYAGIFGMPFWEDLEAHPHLARQFDEMIGPAGHGRPDPEILHPDDWAAVRSIADIGGGTGALLIEIARRHAHVRCTFVELPRTIDRARIAIAEATMNERIELIAGSFFDPLPAGHDCYVLKSVLNDWPDDDAARLLSNCRIAANESSRLIVIGGVSPADRQPMLSIESVLLGGRERTLHEFSQTAETQGWRVVATRTQSSGRFVVECRPT